MELNNLIEKGGKHWQRLPKINRVYFDAKQVMDHAGFIITYDITGSRVRAAQIRGEQISNATGMNLNFAFNDKKFKLYYDLILDHWEYKLPPCGITVERELVQSLRDFMAYVAGIDEV